MSATVAALSSVSLKSGRIRHARSANNSSASSASDSDGTCQVTSPAARIGSRLVARSRNPAQAPNSPVASNAVASKQMFAVVRHDQHVAVRDEPAQGDHRRGAGLVGQPERSSDRHRHDIGMSDRRQIDIPGAVAELAGDLRGDLNRQTRLAGPAGAGQCHQPVVAQQCPHLIDLRGASDKTRELNRKVVRINACRRA